jgi:murein DD-endopeptidase MepM/ murein hydrolase activator NlpD
MHISSRSRHVVPKLLIPILCAGGIILAAATPSPGDIYRFITIDGVETFTDAPHTKGATLVIRDSSRKQRSGKKVTTAQKTHDISLDEIVEKTVTTSLGSRTPSGNSAIEPHLPPVGGAITSGVGMRIDPIDGKLRYHNGIDIAVPEGTPVKPAAPGAVVYSGQRPGYGYTILIEHDNGMVTLYGHNSRLIAAPGQRVDTDTIIAYSGNTGRSTGPHLHFEAWQAGTNITQAFMPGNTMQLPKIRMAASKPKAHFRKEILADGSVLFTNLPSSVP